MKIWLDDVRPAPDGYIWCKSVNQAKTEIKYVEGAAYLGEQDTIELIDCDHDSGDYEKDGGPYIKLLDWLEATGRNYPIKIHSMNQVGCQNMRRIIQHNGWKEVK